MIYKELPTSSVVIDTSFKPKVFSESEIQRMKQFFLRNSSLPDQPKGGSWKKIYKHKCINTVRAGLEILLFGNSTIPDSLFSQRKIFNGDFQTNDVQGLASRLVKNRYLSDPDTLFFEAKNKGEWLPIIKSNELQRSLRPIKLQGSLWNTLQAKTRDKEGFSVFIISLCEGQHAATLTVDHRNPTQMFFYWSDQTHRHPYRYFIDGKLKEVKNKYGWEGMVSYGPDTLQRSKARGLDQYILYAINKYWCDCKRKNQKPDDCCGGKCFPMIVIWQVGKPLEDN